MKKALALLWIGVLCLGLLLYSFSLREPSQPNPSTAPSTEATEPLPGQVRFLNNDPSLHSTWEALAAEFTRQTGLEVTVISSAAASAYTSAQKIPTLFTVGSEEELAACADLCLDLSGTEAYAQLASWGLTLRSGDKVCGIAAEMEAFGLVCNAPLLAQAGYTRTDINSFSDLKAAAESITANSDELGFSAFARVNLNDSFTAWMAALPGDTRAFFDVFINNSTCAPEEMRNSTEHSALEDFLAGKAVFYLTGTEQHEKMAYIGGENLTILPIYLDGENEENQSLCATATRYWCIRNDTPEQDIQAAVAFLNFLVQPRADGTVPVDDLGLLAPYRQATSAANAFETVLRGELAAGKELLICKNVPEIPAGLSDALIAYTIAPSDQNWAAVLQALSE